MKNFVIFASPFDYHQYSYSDVLDTNNVEYIVKSIHSNNKFLNLLFKVHCSLKTNKYINIPFKKLWFNQLSHFKFDDDIIFIFFAGTTRFNLIKSGYIEYLKKRYPNSKFCCYYTDLVKWHQHEVDINYVKKTFDYVYSFDQNDCLKYELDYHQLVYSSTFNPDKNNICNDVYFVGLAKDRLNEIIEAFKKLSSKGLKCDFHIVGVKKEDRIFEDEIDYCKNVTYEDNLKYISKSKSILEIMQKGGYGFTLRTCEAIMFDKMLITNNCTIKEAPFYSRENIVAIDEIDNNDWDYLKNNSSFNYNFKNSLSPKRFLAELEQRIEKSL